MDLLFFLDVIVRRDNFVSTIMPLTLVFKNYLFVIYLQKHVSITLTKPVQSKT